MKEALSEVMSQFYTDGVPTDAIGRQGRFPEVRNCEIVTWDEEGDEDGIRIVPAWNNMIAESKPAEKEMMVNLVMTFLA